MSSPSSVPVLTQHTVRLGDSLSEIAKFYYGKSSNALVELIFRANTDLLDDPDEIFQGDVIRILSHQLKVQEGLLKVCHLQRMSKSHNGPS